MAKSAVPKPLRDEVATAEKDQDLFAGWLTRMENPDEVVRAEAAGRGVKLYEELERDWQVFSMLQTRILAVQSCEWQVDPATEKRADKKIAEFVEEVLEETNFDKLCGDLMQAVLTGYKPVEVMWDASSGELRVKEFRGRRPGRFVFDMEGNLRLLTMQSPFDGEPVPDRKFITYTFGGHDHNPYGRGLGHQLYWPVWFKKNEVKFWMVFSEKFGSPTMVGKYPPGTTEPDKATLLAAMRGVQQQTGIRIPNTMEIELLEAQRTSSSGVYGELCTYMDKAIAKILLGQTLTSEAGDVGSYSLGKVHNDVRKDIVKADADLLSETINNTIVRWLVDFNFPSAGRAGYPKVWRKTEEDVDLQALATRDKILLVDMGFSKRVPESYLSETYGIPLAKDGEATVSSPEPKPVMPKPGLLPLKAKATAPEGPSDDGAEFAERKTLALGQTVLEISAEKAAAEASDEMEKLLAPVLRAIEDATSLEEIGETIYSMYPRLDSSRFQELLARAMLAAGITGYGAAKGDNA